MSRGVVRMLVALVAIGIVFTVLARWLRHSRLAIPVLVAVAVVLVVAGRAMWRSKRAALEEAARRREEMFYILNKPKRGGGPRADS